MTKREHEIILAEKWCIICYRGTNGDTDSYIYRKALDRYSDLLEKQKLEDTYGLVMQ